MPVSRPWTRAVLPVAKATTVSGRDVAQRGQVGHQPQDAERHDAGPGRGVVAEDDPAAARPAADAGERVQRGPAVAAMDELERDAACRAATSRSMSASDSDVVPPLMWPAMSGLRLEHGVRADGARPGQRRTAGVERRDHAVGAAPGDHRRGIRPGLDRAEPDLADEPDAAGGHLGEVGLDQAHARGSARRRGP